MTSDVTAIACFCCDLHWKLLEAMGSVVMPATYIVTVYRAVMLAYSKHFLVQLSF